MRVRKSKRPQRRKCRADLISVGSVILLHVFFHPSRGEIWKQLIKWRWRTHCCCRSLHSLRTRRPNLDITSLADSYNDWQVWWRGGSSVQFSSQMSVKTFIIVLNTQVCDSVKHSEAAANRRHADNRTVELMNTEGAGHYWTAVPISSHFSQIRSGFGSTNISQRLNILIGRFKLISGRFYRFFTDLFDHNKLQVNGNTAFIILLSLRRESITVFSSTGEDPSRLQEETEPCLNSVSVTRPGNRSKSLWTHEPIFTFEAGLKRPYTRLLYIQTLNWIIKTISFSEVEQVCRDLSRCCRLVNKAQKNKEKLTQHRYTQDSRTKSNTAIYPQCLYLHTNNCVQSKWCCRLTVNDGNNIVSAASVRSHSSSPFALGCSSSREVRERRSAQSLHLFNISADSFLLC